MNQAKLLTAERAARHEAESRCQQRDLFFATLGHELRSPLAGVLGGIEVLDRTFGDRPEAGKVVSLVRRQALDLRRLLDEFLDVTRLSLDEMMLEVEIVDLRKVVDLVVQAESPGFEQKLQTLALALPERPVTVEGDALRLRQILGNLLCNASKYSPAGSSVTVDLREFEDMAVVSVADCGAGIAGDRLDTIFELFYRQPESALQPGLGIGLPLVKRLVELHRGKVEAASDGPGCGATFTVKIPLATASAEASKRLKNRQCC